MKRCLCRLQNNILMKSWMKDERGIDGFVVLIIVVLIAIIVGGTLLNASDTTLEGLWTSLVARIRSVFQL